LPQTKRGIAASCRERDQPQTDKLTTMPQITLHHGSFDVQMQISSQAPTDVYRLADQLVELVRMLVGKVAEAKLADRLREELGPDGTAGNCFDEDCEAECPRCESGAAYRKGTRPKTVEVPRLGTVKVERPYLECRHCGRSYVPYEAGTPERGRYGQEALRRPIEATMETSYRRGAEAYPESPSERTLWRIVNEGPPDSKENAPLEADAEAAEMGTCVADATRIPAREEDAQHSLSIAHAVEPDKTGGPGGRPALNRQPVAARVGSETRLRKALSEVSIATLVTDGQMDVSSVADKTGRCRWHLPRSVRHLLYNDDVSGDRNQQLTGEVRDLVYTDYANPVAARTVLTRWAAVRRQEAPQAAGHVGRAAPQIGVYARSDPPPSADFAVETTAPAEREMRELNRRFENGGQWTRSGAENLLQWHQIYRHDRKRWTEWFPNSTPI
jgi:YgiT-type zinc finger domain-containing protein